MWGRIPSSSTSSGTPVYLNIYDLTPINGYMYWLGLGIYHSAVEAYGVEYAFGAHDYPTSGVFEVEPRTCPGFTFRKTVLLGTTNLGQKEFREFIEQIAFEYGGNSYHLIVKNCNHFCDDVCMRLTGSSIPGWVNRLARLGSLCNCLLPEGLQVNAVPQISEYQAYEGEAEDPRSTYRQLTTSLATVAPRKRPLSVSSIFLQYSFRGGVTPWDWKSSNLIKERLRHL